ncbi:oligosaccharide flippase family protein [Pseudoalteromonas sp. C2R02]|uniref:oligosaccharide flippase family protein n=1 Tax=Pseudoalteromonas sp. C2R02 TaxID=2841565 RepID=UPI001C09AC2D|nr:oligosaccharide flippase family protein [Pseudoalteromonas sp. C2R02]MBU2972624.1 oligosaccharide flippase family protein [Pseudoalteromonas sp. C2R02]
MSKRLRANISWLALIKITNILLPLITLPYLTLKLGAELFGVFAIGVAIQQIVLSICDYGFGVFAPKLTAENSDKPKVLGKLISAISIIKLLIFISISFIILIILQLIDSSEQYKNIWLLMLLPALIQSLIPVWLFLGVEKMVKITISTIIERLIYTALIFSLVLTQSDIELIPLIMTVSLSTSLLVSVFFVWHLNIRLEKVSISYLVELIKEGWGYFYSRLTMLLFSKFNIIIVASVLGEAQAGYFSLAERIYNTGRSLIAPLTDALYPHMVKTKNWNMAYKIIKLAGIFALSSILITYLISDWFFVTVFSAQEFLQASEIFKILILAFAFSIISMMIGYPVLGVVGHVKAVNFSVLIGASAHLIIIAALWCGDLLTGKSLALSLVFTEGFIFLYRLKYLKHSKVFHEASLQQKTNGVAS